MTLKKCQLTCAVGNLGGFSLPANFFWGEKSHLHMCVYIAVGAHMSKYTPRKLEILLPLVSFRGN